MWDKVYLGIQILSPVAMALVFLYDRWSRQRTEISKTATEKALTEQTVDRLDKTNTALEERLDALTQAVTTLTAEFRMYVKLRNGSVA